MIGTIRQKITPKIVMVTGITIALLALQSQEVAAQSVFIPGMDTRDTSETRQQAGIQAGMQVNGMRQTNLTAQCSGEAAGSNCGAVNNRQQANSQQAHVTLALLYLGIRDRCMDRSCRLSVRSIQR